MPKAKWESDGDAVTADSSEEVAKKPERYREKVLVLFTESQVRLLDETAAERRINRSDLIRGAVLEECERDSSDMSWCRLCGGSFDSGLMVRLKGAVPVCVHCIGDLQKAPLGTGLESND